jgi:purine-binding chemotaxis protein CheW
MNSEHKQILEKRAVALAREEMVQDDRLCLEVTSFHLGDERYAVDTWLIREVIPLGGLTPLPCVPPFIAGIMNVRGRILSLIDTRHLLELPGVRPDSGKVIILAAGAMEFGLVVDEIGEVIRIPVDDIQESIPMIEEKKSAYFRGITVDRMILLDGECLLHDPRLVIHEHVH